MRQEYEESDIQEILTIAVRSDASRRAGREALLMSARELGISEEALAEAELEYLREKAAREELQEFRAYRRRSVLEHLGSYVIVNGFLVILNLLNWHGHLWAIYPILGWGVGLAFHLTECLGKGDSFDREFARWKRRRERRLSGETADEDEDPLEDLIQARLATHRGPRGPRRP